MEFFSSLSNFDLTFLSIIGISMLFGIVRGFIKSVLSMIGWVMSAFIAIHFSHHAIPLIAKYDIQNSTAEIMAVIATFISSAIIIALLNSVLISIIRCLCGGVIDRSAGLAFGFVRGCALASVLFYVMTLFFPGQLYVKNREELPKIEKKMPHWAQNSKFILLLSRGADHVSTYLPNKFKHELSQSIEEVVDENEHITTPLQTSQEHTPTIAQLLKTLPPQFVESIPDETLIAIQDNATTPQLRKDMLNSIAEQYTSYHNQHVDLKYNNNMEILEGILSQYNQAIINTQE